MTRILTLAQTFIPTKTLILAPNHTLAPPLALVPTLALAQILTQALTLTLVQTPILGTTLILPPTGPGEVPHSDKENKQQNLQVIRPHKGQRQFCQTGEFSI
jgi:hypothetical protein